MGGFRAKNQNDFQSYLCVSCKLILWKPVQLSCGHRLCNVCVKIISKDSEDSRQIRKYITCTVCQQDTDEFEAKRDRGCYNDMQRSIVQCIECNWTDQFKNYAKHLQDCHQLHQIREDISSTTFNDFSVHQQIECAEIQTPSSSSETANVNQEVPSIQSEQIPTEARILMGQTRPIHSVKRVSTNENNSQVDEARRVIQMLEASLRNITEDVEYLRRTVNQTRNSVLNIMEGLDRLRVAENEYNTVLLNQTSLMQDLAFVQQQVDEFTQTSYEGSYMWIINDVQAKMRAAEQDTQSAPLYSPSIYSSRYGHGLRVQLFLNGDAAARGTYMSLFFVPLCNEYSTILPSLPSFKVIFCLYDQSDDKRHIIGCFKPDSTLYNAQQQSLSMNLPDEFSKFCQLETLRQENSPYTKDNTMYIRVIIDFFDLSSDMISFVLNLNPGLPTHIQQQMIQDEIQRRAQ